MAAENRLTAEQLAALAAGDAVVIETSGDFRRPKLTTGTVVRVDAADGRGSGIGQQSKLRILPPHLVRAWAVTHPGDRHTDWAHLRVTSRQSKLVEVRSTPEA